MTIPEVKLEPGWLLRDVRKATDRLKEWAMTAPPTLSLDDLRYLSMLAWRQGTRRAEDIADRIDAMLARRQQPQRQVTSSYEEYLAGYHGAIAPKTREQFETAVLSDVCQHGLIWGNDTCIPPPKLQAYWEKTRFRMSQHNGVDDDTWIPPYARSKPARARLARLNDKLVREEWERAQQAEACKHFDVV